MQRNGDDDRQRLLVRQEHEQEQELQDDEQLLGGADSPPHFVPAFVDDSDERSLLERDQDEVMLMSSAPTSGAGLTYCVFYLLGIGTMTPWNFFVTAEDVSGARSGLAAGLSWTGTVAQGQSQACIQASRQGQCTEMGRLIYMCSKCITFASYLFPPRYILLFIAVLLLLLSLSSLVFFVCLLCFLFDSTRSNPVPPPPRSSILLTVLEVQVPQCQREQQSAL